MRIRKVILSIAVSISLLSCSKKIDSNIVLNDDNELQSFTLSPEFNEELESIIIADIDNEEGIIQLQISELINLSNLAPNIVVADNALIEPGNLVQQDFNQNISYTVTAQSGAEKKYEVQVNSLSTKKDLFYFSFLKSDNNILNSEEFIGEIDVENNKIYLQLPFGVSLLELKPFVKISEKATIIPSIEKSQDFSKPVNYEIKAEDGTSKIYTVTVEQPKMSERDVLIAIHNANPGNFLGWDIEDDNISSWNQVEVKDGKVVSLNLSANRGGVLRVLPPAIENLVFLENLNLHLITETPEELYKLSNLKSLSMIALPTDDIGLLENLEQLYFGPYIGRSNLAILPPSIKNLQKLKYLSLGRGEFYEFPKEILSIESLEFLSINNNFLSSIPKEIGQMTNLLELDLGENNLTDIPEEISSLSNLENLVLNSNKIESLPVSLGNMISLKKLDISNNSLTVIPQEICNLANSGTVIEKDENVVCE